MLPPFHLAGIDRHVIYRELGRQKKNMDIKKKKIRRHYMKHVTNMNYIIDCIK